MRSTPADLYGFFDTCKAVLYFSRERYFKKTKYHFLRAASQIRGSVSVGLPLAMGDRRNFKVARLYDGQFSSDSN